MSYIITNKDKLVLKKQLPLGSALWTDNYNEALRFSNKKEVKEVVKELNARKDLIKAYVVKIED